MGFHLRQRVRLLTPQMTKVSGRRTVRYGTIIFIDGAYHTVKPDGWPRGAYIELYPCEIAPCLKKSVTART